MRHLPRYALRVALACVVPLLFVCGLQLATGCEWPQFRGPTGQGHADSSRLPVKWSETSGIAWKTALPGLGWSSPVICEGKIWVTSATNEGHELHALCVDAASGRLLRDVVVFRLSDPPPVNPKNSHASPTPVVEAGRLYVHFGTMGTACLDTNTGEVLWTNHELKIDHKEGPGSSPILFENLLIVHCDGMDTQYVVALDKRNGRIVWKTMRSGTNDPNPDFRKAYATPLVIDAQDRQELISPAADRTSAYDPRTGQELWWVDYKGFSNVPRPIYNGEFVFICTGFTRPQLWAVRPGGAGDVTDSHVVWKQLQQVPRNSSPIIVGEAIYMVSDRGVASCIDARTGQVQWKERIGGNYSASPLSGAGSIYFFSEEGTTTVVAPTTSGLKRLATNTLDGRIMATPAVLGESIILRTDTHLYRIDDTAASGQSVSGGQ